MRESTRLGREAEADRIVERVRYTLKRRMTTPGRKYIGVAVPWGSVAATRAKLRAEFPEHVVKVEVQR